RVKMVTGDDTAIAIETARQLGMGTHIIPAAEAFPKDMDPNNVPPGIADAIERADGFARVFPEHKYAIVTALQARGHLVAMTGDGVNDAPALKQADCGPAVSGATDAARGAAALILTAPGLSVINSAIDEARRIFGRITTYTIYRIALTMDIMFNDPSSPPPSYRIEESDQSGSEGFFPCSTAANPYLALSRTYKGYRFFSAT